ncbi:homocysteine-responsive endoplasmic reticulum-resident ubiquitin-like domain member 2 protein isoform X2 [Hippocampus comes]|uniref:homocysteine-responsive endoplasmic reticulum-resident ubiquitin-like domain member 2 protein isoform X2 n=1 Tax=Hippocampus comes TaxID=109280 RepID=UPI00094E1169|nr:PREDICTED: homocysteine-responsive endoplasmic reticulum-resident ubiquitin-like domain member 2 protein isoform X2 [Hippocampus comes]
MESGGADTPVTLVIKASDQKHEDCTINCFLSWTVEELKSHIATVYPSKPRSRDQQLVYSGKLLQDHLQLRDVLRQPHNEYAILHLMCGSCTPPGSPATHCPSALNAGLLTCPLIFVKSSESARSALRDSTSISGGPDDLRRRGGIVSLNPLSPAGIPRLPQGGAPTPLRGGQMLMPIQMLWWQQMYARHYYMQYQAAVVASQTPSFPSATSQLPPSRPNEAALAPAVPDADPLPENLALPPAANANIQINVQGGGALNEDELNRDWLDWLYALFRGCVLLSFVYFHCSFGHFIMVVGAMMLVYLHQVGWFPFRTVAHQQQQQELPNFQDPEQAQAWEEAEMQRGIWELERVMDNGMDEAQQEDPGLLATACSFVRIFFSSLIPEGWPQRPPALPPVLRPH